MLILLIVPSCSSAGCKARAEEGLFEKASGGFNGKVSLGEDQQLLQFLKG